MDRRLFGVWHSLGACHVIWSQQRQSRPRVSQTDVAEALVRGLFHDGKPYDFDFDFTRSDRLVCTEVVYRSFDNVGGVNFELTQRAGRLTLAAEDLIRMALDHKHFDVVAVFAPPFAERLLTGDPADEAIRKTQEAEAPAS